MIHLHWDDFPRNRAFKGHKFFQKELRNIKIFKTLSHNVLIWKIYWQSETYLKAYVLPGTYHRFFENEIEFLNLSNSLVKEASFFKF